MAQNPSAPPPLYVMHKSPQEVVLLEDSDLYSYHGKPRQHWDADDELETIPVAQPYSGLDHFLHHSIIKVTSSFVPSERHSERAGDTRLFQLHATPNQSVPALKPSLSSTDTATLAQGALRPGGAVNLFSRHHIGLLLNWSIVGFFTGSLAAITAPLLFVYLGYDDSQLNAATAVLSIPWSLNFLAGFLTDCIPINRLRRKPYIYIGWTVLVVLMLAMALLGTPTPRKKNGVVVDDDAASQGARYVMLTMAGSIGHVIVTVAMEGMMVEFAQREAELVRGRTQCWCMVARCIGEVIGALFIAFSLNSEEYGGHFAHSVPLQAVSVCLAAAAVAGILVTQFFLKEEKISVSSQRLATQLRRIWNILQQRTTWQITVLGFLVQAASVYDIQESREVFTVWLGAEVIALSLADVITSTGGIIAAALFMAFLLNTNWRAILIAAVALGLVVMVPVDLVTVFDEWRRLPLFMAKTQVVSVADSFLFIVRTVVITEVAEPGYEAVTFGVITTVANLGTSVVSMIKNIVATKFASSTTNLALDTYSVRLHVLHQFIVKYGLRMLMVALVLPLLPRQKRHLQEIRERSSTTIIAPVVVFVVFAVLFVVSVTSDLLAVFESTSCHVFAGGRGC